MQDFPQHQLSRHHLLLIHLPIATVGLLSLFILSPRSCPGPGSRQAPWCLEILVLASSMKARPALLKQPGNAHVLQVLPSSFLFSNPSFGTSHLPRTLHPKLYGACQAADQWKYRCGPRFRMSWRLLTLTLQAMRQALSKF